MTLFIPVEDAYVESRNQETNKGREQRSIYLCFLYPFLNPPSIVNIQYILENKDWMPQDLFG